MLITYKVLKRIVWEYFDRCVRSKPVAVPGLTLTHQALAVQWLAAI